MADDADKAQEVVELFHREARMPVAAIRASLFGPGADRCVNCGEDIPARRREVVPAARRCLPCQTDFERKP